MNCKEIILSPILSPEGDDSVQSGPAPLQPAVGEETWRAAVDL